ncbi:MAG: ferrous iron transport protein A [Desulforhopalus sp.]
MEYLKISLTGEIMNGKKGKQNNCGFTNKVRNCFGRSSCKITETPLSQNGHCRKVKVCKVTGDRKVCARMASLGLYPGVEADVICAQQGNQCMVKVNGGTISLDASISDNIYVTDL